MDYIVELDPETGDYIVTAGNDTYSVGSIHLAYIWLASQLLDDDESEPT